LSKKVPYVRLSLSAKSINKSINSSIITYQPQQTRPSVFNHRQKGLPSILREAPEGDGIGTELMNGLFDRISRPKTIN